MDSPSIKTLKKSATRRWVVVGGFAHPFGPCATYYWFEDQVWLHVSDPKVATHFFNGKTIVPTMWGADDMAERVAAGRILELLPDDGFVTEDGRHQTPADSPVVTDPGVEK